VNEILDEAIYQSIVKQSVDAVVITDRSGDIIFWNTAAERIFGYTVRDVIGKYVHDILPAHDLRDKANRSFDEFKKNGAGPSIGKELQVRGIKKNGDCIHVLFNPSTVEVNGELFIFAFLRDISELILLQEKLKYQATTDELTGVLNRRAFFKQAERTFRMSLRHKEPFSLFMMDVDLFKNINDEYGHCIGDVALQKFAETISVQCRCEDIFGRIGGEEFCLAMGKTDRKDALDIAERMRSETQKLIIATDDASFGLTVSIGVSTYRGAEDALQEMQKRCDDALYQSKGKGRNCVVFG